MTALLDLLRGHWRVLALAGLATFLVSFDSAVVTLGLPAISRDFGTPTATVARLGSFFSLGTLAGLPLAMQADRLGRRRLLIAAVALLSVTNLASAWSPSIGWLIAMRALAVAFETAVGGAATALIVEEVGPTQRGLAVAAITITAGAGTGLTTVLYPLLAPNWRVLYLFGGVGVAGAVVLAVALRESTAWLESVAAGPAPPLRTLASPRWRARLAIAAASALLGALLYEPANLLFALFGSRNLGLAPAAISATVVVSGAFSLPAFGVGGWLSDRFGRRGLAAAIAALTAIATAATFSGPVAAYWAGSITWSVLASASVPIFGAWFGELFPTHARATSEALSSVAGAVGGAIGYQLVGLLSPLTGLGTSLMLPAGLALVAAGLLLLLPETRARPLDP